MSTPAIALAASAHLSPRLLPCDISQARRTDAHPTHREDGLVASTAAYRGNGQQADRAIAALRTSLAEVLVVQEQNVSELHQTVDDLAGETDVDSVLAREVAESFSFRGLDVIAEVRHALRRIDNGTFGACERCGNQIPLERLEVIPYARRCVSCPSAVPRLIG